MISLKEIGTMLEANGNLNVNFADGELTITEKGHVGIEDLEITKFIKVFDKSAEIKKSSNKIIITATAFSAQRLMMVLMSVYSSEFNFVVTDEFTLELSKKSANEAEEKDADKKEEESDKEESDKKDDDKKDDDKKEEESDKKDESILTESLMDIAEAVDAENLEISVNKDTLVIESKDDLMEVAESIDSKFKGVKVTLTSENLTIELGDE